MSTKTQNSEWWEWLQAIIIAIIIASVIKIFLFELIEVEGNSMYPTLHNQDRLIVNKIGYIIGEPDYGDIVIFKYPADPSINFIKRIVAREGDIVEIKDNNLYINDVKMLEPYINEQELGQFERVKVPKGSFFVLGDNRNNSRDSRYADVGFLEKEDIRGSAIIRIWPLSSVNILE